MIAPFKGRLKVGQTQSFNHRGDLCPATVSVDVEWTGTRLSIQGDVQRRGARDVDSGGQIVEDVASVDAADLAISETDRDRLVATWKRWHLNDMRAGSPAQEEWLRDHPRNGRYPGGSHYEWAKDALARAGLQPDPNHGDYSYGSAWLTEDVPVEVLTWLYGLVTA